MKHLTSDRPQRENICHYEEDSNNEHEIECASRQSSSLKFGGRHGSRKTMRMLSVICASSALFVFVQQQYLSHSHESLPSGRQHHAAGENSGIGRNSVSDSHDITDVHGLSFVGVSIHKEAEQRTMYGKLRDTQQLSQSSVVLLKTFRSKTRKMKDGRHRKLSHRQRQKAARRMTQMEQPLVIAAAESKSPSVNAISQETLVDNRTLFQTYRMSHPYPGVLSVHVTGNISYRLKQFNVAVDQLRLQLWNELNAAEHQNTNQSSISDSSLAPDVKFDSVFGYGDNGNDSNTNRVSRVPRRWRPWSNDQLLVAGGGRGLQRTQQSSKHVIIINEDDYLQRLSARFPLVRIIVLPWLSSQQRTKTSPTDELVSWSSRNDTANLFVENYYKWTTQHPICSWIRKSFSSHKLHNGLFFQPQCLTLSINAALQMTITDESKSPVAHSSRKPPTVDDVLDTPNSLSPLHLHAKSIQRDKYWPNNGRSYPASFYREPPEFAVQLHVLHDAVAMPNGDVIGAGRRIVNRDERDQSNATSSSSEQYENVKMARYSCMQKVDESFIRVPVTTKSHDEVFVISTMGASNYYHRLVEQLPRIAPYIDFLRRNPTIRIHIRQLESAKDNTSRSMTAALLVAMGITDAGGRIVTGVVRATVAYVPRFAECLWSRPVELQVMSHLLRRHTTTKLFSGGSQGSGSSAKGVPTSRDAERRSPTAVDRRLHQLSTGQSLPTRVRNRVVMIRRSGIRRLADGQLIETAVERLAATHGLRITPFGDKPPPSLEETMRLFNEAVMVIAPHGAGLANVVFCEPGTYVVEIVCQSPFTKLCYLHTSHSLGHRYYAIPATSGCPDVVKVSRKVVEKTVKTILNHWSKMKVANGN